MGEYIVVILHIYWDIAVFLLFCHHQDTELESLDIENGEYVTVVTQKNTPGDLWDNDIHNLQHGKII